MACRTYDRAMGCAALLRVYDGRRPGRDRSPAPGTIQLKNGQSLDGRFSLHLDGGVPRLEVVRADNQQRMIPINNVKAFRHGERFVVNHGIVRPNNLTQSIVEERLVVRHVEGRINLYAPISATSPRFPDAYFSTGDGPIRTVHYSTLRDAVQGHPESAALMSSSRTWHWTHIGLVTTGAAASAAGLLLSFNQTEPVIGQRSQHAKTTFSPHALLYTGLGMVATSFIARAIKQAKFRDAIETYNR